MTETAKEIFEKYQVRKTKKQKSKFIEFAKIKAEELNYEVKVENVKVEATKTVNVEEKKEEVAEEPAPKEEEIIPEGFEPAEFSEDSQIDF